MAGRGECGSSSPSLPPATLTTSSTISPSTTPAAERVYRAIVTAAHTRELSIVALPYIIVDQGSSDTVTVVAVFHGARDLARAVRERRKEIEP